MSLETYVQQVRRQSVRNVEVHPPDVERAFAHLVIDSKTLWQIGTALNSGTSIFLHGPTGVGKTTIAETLARVLAEDEVWIPFAVEVDGQIISVYDPLVHKSVSEQKSEDGTVGMITSCEGLLAQRHFRRIARKSNSFGRMRQDIVLWQSAETLPIILGELRWALITNAIARLTDSERIHQ